MDHAAGIFLVLVAIATLPGFMMFWLRRGHRGGPPRSRTHFIVERSSIMSGAILAAIGFELLASAFQNAGGVLAIIGATAYLFGAVLLVAGEALSLAMGYEKLYPVIVIYVVMAFLAQAAIGGAVIQSALLAASIGWIMILWNIVWLIVLSLFSRRDMYFPVLHYVMPLVMGIALLLSMP